MGEEGRVYATPYLIGDIEMTCRNLILAHADANEDSVGMEVAVKHLAPTLPGMTVEITVAVTAVEGRKVMFAVTAKDDLDTVSSGSHARFVVDKAKTVERLKAQGGEARRTGGVMSAGALHVRSRRRDDAAARSRRAAARKAQGTRSRAPMNASRRCAASSTPPA